MKRKGGIGSHHRAPNGLADEWLTPPEIIRSLGSFDLDPCASVIRPWKTARRHFTIKDDGLEKKWSGRVWLNPPYGPTSGQWMDRLAAHHNGIALTFARTDTEWFQRASKKATGLLFLAGRLHFHYVDGRRAKHNCGGPSVLMAFDATNANCLEKSMLPGWYVFQRENWR